MNAKVLNIVYYIALLLTFIGGLNWAIVAYKDFDSSLVEKVNELTFKNPNFAKIVYALVGVSSVYVLVANITMFRKSGYDLPFQQ